MLCSTHFIYNGINSKDFNVIVCEIGSSSSVNTIDLGVKRTIVEDSVTGRRVPLFYGTQRKEKLSMTFSISKCCSGEEFSTEETRRLVRWLFGKSGYEWLQLCDLDYKDIYYRLIFTDIRPVAAGGKTVGFTLYAECDSPFAWSAEKVFLYKSLPDVVTTYLIANEADDCDYIYPDLELLCYSNTDISIINESDNNREMRWNNTPVSVQPIKIDGKNRVCRLTDGLSMDNFNFEFFRLVPGDNVISLQGAFEARFSFREPVIVNYD